MQHARFQAGGVLDDTPAARRHPGGALVLWPALTPALAADPCAEGLDRLGQRIAALEAAGPQIPAAVTPQETAQLRALQQVAQRTAQAGNAQGCAVILAQAEALQRAIGKPRVVAAEDLQRATLRGSDGEQVGKVSELVVDPTTGRVAYAVVELSGFLGLSERHFPVPWALFQPSGDGYVLNVPKDRLTGAPQFTSSNRPDMSDRQWAMALHTYYGVPPYWVQDGAALAAAGAMPGGNGAAPAALQQEVQRLSQEVDRLNGELAQAHGGPGPADGPAAGSSGGEAPPSGAAGNAPSPPAANQ
ncbi:hypothetical protein DEW08_11855 [Azospirillum thermophilum]|uniref:PRC-barrel domain-containing protein n=1 Tax=Azospirillum thermophilum TaxID=2202148 RepID=A0A2S2CTY9_9PROT|nr:hypothetical protein DEW08_11855 [Azospirillum thermophilum]